MLGAGLLDELCNASACLSVALQQHRGTLVRCHALSGAVLELWCTLAVVWPGKLLLGNTIAQSVLPISQLATAVLTGCQPQQPSAAGKAA